MNHIKSTIRVIGVGFLTIAAGAANDKPNIIYIMTDDIGYGDVGCYGATHVKTPRIDRLAGEGMRFTDAHSTASVCTPTLATLADLVGQALPEDAAPDSFNVLPAWLGQKTDKPCRDHLVFQNNGPQPLALRRGDLVLIENNLRNRPKARPHELFDLSKDPAQTNDIAASESQQVLSIASLLQKLRENGGSRPYFKELEGGIGRFLSGGSRKSASEKLKAVRTEPMPELMSIEKHIKSKPEKAYLDWKAGLNVQIAENPEESEDGGGGTE